MPFGITSPPEEFQRRMDLTLGGLDGTKAIADNILVFGTGSTQEEAEKSHDERLTAVLERCRQKGVRLNNDKMQFKQPNYVQRFDPGLADATKPFRDLLKKESVFMWDQGHCKAFNAVKSILTKAHVLKYLSQEKKSVL